MALHFLRVKVKDCAHHRIEDDVRGTVRLAAIPLSGHKTVTVCYWIAEWIAVKRCNGTTCRKECHGTRVALLRLVRLPTAIRSMCMVFVRTETLAVGLLSHALRTDFLFILQRGWDLALALPVFFRGGGKGRPSQGAGPGPPAPRCLRRALEQVEKSMR